MPDAPWEKYAARGGGKPWEKYGGSDSAPSRGIIDQLTGATGPRYQTFPERAVRGVAGMFEHGVETTKKAMTGELGPPGSREFSAGAVPGMTDAAMLLTPKVPGAVGEMAGGLAKAATPAPKVPAAPSREELFAAGERGYEQARGMDLTMKAEAGKTLFDKISNEFTQMGVDENLAPKTFGILSKLTQPPEGSVMTVANLESLRRTLGNAARSVDNTERLAAKLAQNQLDDFLANLPPNAVISGDAKAASAILSEARGNWAAAARSAELDRKLIRAELRAASTGSGQNVANTIRQRMADILINPAMKRGYAPEELAQMEKIVRGTRTGNALRGIGNILGGGGGLGTVASSTAGALATGSPFGALLPGVGYAAKKASNLSTLRQAGKLDEMLRRRSPLYEQQNPLAAP